MRTLNTTLLLFYLALFFTCLQIKQAYAVDANQELMTKAEEAFKKGSYQDAHKLYSALTTNESVTGPNPAAYYYNYATMLARAENYGLAYALLLRAKRLNPIDKEIDHNLDFVKSRISPQATAIHPGSASIDFIPEFLKKYSIIFLALAFLFFSIDFLLLLQKKNVLLHYPALFTAIIFLIAYLSIQSLKAVDTGILLPKNSTLRSGPNISFPDLITVPAGAHVRLLELTNGWYKLSFLSNLNPAKEVIGWVEQNAVLPLNSSSAPPSQNE